MTAAAALHAAPDFRGDGFQTTFLFPICITRHYHFDIVFNHPPDLYVNFLKNDPAQRLAHSLTFQVILPACGSKDFQRLLKFYCITQHHQPFYRQG